MSWNERLRVGKKIDLDELSDSPLRDAAASEHECLETLPEQATIERNANDIEGTHIRDDEKKVMASTTMDDATMVDFAETRTRSQPVLGQMAPCSVSATRVEESICPTGTCVSEVVDDDGDASSLDEKPIEEVIQAGIRTRMQSQLREMMESSESAAEDISKCVGKTKKQKPPAQNTSKEKDATAQDMQIAPLPEEPPEWIYPYSMSVSAANNEGIVNCNAKEEGDDEEGNDSNQKEEDPQRVALFRRSSVVSGGCDHPDSLCEPLAVRDTVPMPFIADDDVRVPKRLLDAGLLSSPQLECVALAAKRFRLMLPCGSRAGYLLGDGTGCGKGRCIAALILDQWNRGRRRHVWISATADLYSDAVRDLADLGANIPVCAMSRIKAYGALDEIPQRSNTEIRKLGDVCDGVLFLTYSMLVSGKGAAAASDPCKSRFGQVVNWLNHHGDEALGLICFDEAHKAKNLDGNSKAATLALELQRSCRGAAVLYASATGATEVAHMQYMERLGLWGLGGAFDVEAASTTPFQVFHQFSSVITHGGMAAMELVAIQLKSMGALSCRSLAFEGTSFELTRVKLDGIQRAQYDAAVTLWRDMYTELQYEVAELLQGQAFAKTKPKHKLSQFWSAQQRFFKGLIVAAKVKAAVELARDAIENDEAVVISLWSTNESAMGEAAARGEGDLDSFASGPELTAERFLDKHFRPSKAAELKKHLYSLSLPPNPIDNLIDSLGGVSCVAEMSGRAVQYRRDDASGEIRAFPRRPASGTQLLSSGRGRTRSAGVTADVDCTAVDSANVVEQRAFQSGQKLVAIITEAASAGISLHSDRREVRPGCAPPRRRRMLCLELPWAADKAVQQLGRIHRSNQLHPPSFVCVVTDVGGEARFVSAVTRRLRQLGAMTKGDRHAGLGTSGDAFGFGRLDLMGGPYGTQGLMKMLEHIERKSQTNTGCLPHRGMPPPTPPGWASWSSFADAALREIKNQMLSSEAISAGSMSGKKDGMKRFLNRMLGMTCSMQSALFATLAWYVDSVEAADRNSGRLDEGVVTLNSHGRLGRVRSVEECRIEPIGGQRLGLWVHELILDRGLSWEAAKKKLDESPEDPDGAQGFYFRPVHNVPSESVLVLRRWLDLDTPTYKLHYPHMPSTNKLPLPESGLCTLERLSGSCLQRCEASQAANVEETWSQQYTRSAIQCIHRQRGQQCEKSSLLSKTSACLMGLRCVREVLVTGQILAHWSVLNKFMGGRTPLVRTMLSDGRVLVGVLVGSGEEAKLRKVLEEHCALLEQQDRMACGPLVEKQIDNVRPSGDSDLESEDEMERIPDQIAHRSAPEASFISSRISEPAWASGPPTKRARHDLPPSDGYLQPCNPAEAFRWPDPSEFTCGVPIQAPPRTTNAELISSVASSPANSSDDEQIGSLSDVEIVSEVKRKTRPDDDFATIMNRIRAGPARVSQASAPAIPECTEPNRLDIAPPLPKQPQPEQQAPKPRETRPVNQPGAKTCRIDDQVVGLPRNGGSNLENNRRPDQQPPDGTSDRLAAAASGGQGQMVHPAVVRSATTTSQPLRPEAAASGWLTRPSIGRAGDQSASATEQPDHQPPTDRLAILRARVRARQAGKFSEQVPGMLTDPVPTPNGARDLDRFVAPSKYYGQLGFGKSS
jgi:hypothetical protein